jgi:hypothetical protein
VALARPSFADRLHRETPVQPRSRRPHRGSLEVASRRTIELMALARTGFAPVYSPRKRRRHPAWIRGLVPLARGARAGVTKPTARANEVYGVRTGPAASGHTGRSPESANAPFRACEAPGLRQTAFPDLQGRHACRSRTRSSRGPRPAYSEVLMPGFPTGSAYERRSGTDRREGTSRRVFEAGWIAEFEPDRRSDRDRRHADRRQPAPLALPAAAPQGPALSWLRISPSARAPVRRSARAVPTQ